MSVNPGYDRLLEWYQSCARPLPWRDPDCTPWGVLVSEVMLQQTPVTRVLPVWRAWMARWPRVEALAAESPGEAIRMWGRLGYPRRALRLHGAATTVRDMHGGEIPDSLEELRSLPGVGEYTARAVLAFAYGRRVPVVDVNVRRVLARLVDGRADGGRATTARDMTSAEAQLPPQPDRAALLSAALMELGAMVCTARDPACTTCPVLEWCAWNAAGRPGTGVTRRRQTYLGTDRHVRGLLLGAVRESAGGAVPGSELEHVWPDAAQRDRALASLLDDGLLVPVDHAGASVLALPR